MKTRGKTRLHRPATIIDRGIATLGGPTKAALLLQCSSQALQLDRQRGHISNIARAKHFADLTGLSYEAVLGPVAAKAKALVNALS